MHVANVIFTIFLPFAFFIISKTFSVGSFCFSMTSKSTTQKSAKTCDWDWDLKYSLQINFHFRSRGIRTTKYGIETSYLGSTLWNLAPNEYKFITPLADFKGSVCYIIFLIGIHSIQGWRATKRHGVTRKRSTKILKYTRNLLRKNLHLKGVLK